MVGVFLRVSAGGPAQKQGSSGKLAYFRACCDDIFDVIGQWFAFFANFAISKTNYYRHKP